MSDATQNEDENLIDGGKFMPLLGHLAELHGRLIKSAITVTVLFFVAWAFSNPILSLLKVPLAKALPNHPQALHFTGPMDVFMAGMRVSFLTAVVCSCPVWLYQFWRFVEPALYVRERRFILPCIVASVALFALGILFCYALILPITLEFPISMGAEVSAPMITINDYLGMITFMIFGFGFVFETPLVLILLAALGLLSVQTLTTYRRHVVVLTLIVGALLTPPDPLSQVAMAIPLYIMYEISIVIIRAMEAKRRKDARRQETESAT